MNCPRASATSQVTFDRDGFLRPQVTGSHAKVSHSFKLRSDEACYVLSLESQTSMESISIRSDIPIDLLDESRSGGDVIVSKSPATSSDPLLVTYRFQEPTKRFSTNLRTVEGTPGTVNCFVVPSTQPRIAHLINLPVKPLSLHEKVLMKPLDKDRGPVACGNSPLGAFEALSIALAKSVCLAGIFAFTLRFPRSKRNAPSMS